MRTHLAGAIWTALHAAADFQEGIDKLLAQTAIAAPHLQCAASPIRKKATPKRKSSSLFVGSGDSAVGGSASSTAFSATDDRGSDATSDFDVGAGEMHTGPSIPPRLRILPGTLPPADEQT